MIKFRVKLGKPSSDIFDIIKLPQRSESSVDLVFLGDTSCFINEENRLKTMHTQYVLPWQNTVKTLFNCGRLYVTGDLSITVVHTISINNFTIKKCKPSAVRSKGKQMYSYPSSRTSVVVQNTRTRSSRGSTESNVEEAKQDAGIHIFGRLAKSTESQRPWTRIWIISSLCTDIGNKLGFNPFGLTTFRHVLCTLSDKFKPYVRIDVVQVTWQIR